MNVAVQKLLDSFDALPTVDKHQAMIEILRRISPTSNGDLSESALVEAADSLFLALDEEEATRAPR